MKYGLQLYSVRDIAKENVDAMLEGVAKIGYSMVESAEFYNLSSTEFKKMIDKHGLVMCSTHTSIRRLRDELDATIEYHKVIGCNDIVKMTKTTVKATIKELKIEEHLSTESNPNKGKDEINTSSKTIEEKTTNENAKAGTGEQKDETKEAQKVSFKGTSKNSDADESAASFPSYFTKFLRVAPTTRAKFCRI